MRDHITSASQASKYMLHSRVGEYLSPEATSDVEKTKGESGLTLDIERVGSRSRGEVARFLFLEVAGSTDLIGEQNI